MSRRARACIAAAAVLLLTASAAYLGVTQTYAVEYGSFFWAGLAPSPLGRIKGHVSVTARDTGLASGSPAGTASRYRRRFLPRRFGLDEAGRTGVTDWGWIG